MRHLLLTAAATAVILGGGMWWLTAAPPPRPLSVGTTTSTAQFQPPISPPPVVAPTATPNIIAVGTSTLVVFTVSIPEPTLNPANVDLLRINPDGSSSTVVAPMVDNGQNGDQEPGDKMFTARLMLNEAQAGDLTFQVSAAFRGILRRSLSPPAILRVWTRITNISLGYRIEYPPQYYASQPTPTRLLFSDQPNQGLDGDSQGLVTLFVSPRLVSDELSFLRTSIVSGYRETPIFIDGIAGLEVTGLFGPDIFGWGNNTYTIVLMSHRGHTYIFSYETNRTDAVLLFNQLLSRLKLI